ncbi:MAG: bifunctional glutamate N-acetyltransferase/amino-acid acetyltransferase ArgJ [Firmicutes bacterium]|nr:bifunctional glutamate N-acetyltransferase/amino-acid acetyltransferase ArgJ [Bacillota bacterium]
MNIIDGGVTSAKGFKAACTAAGIKYKDRTDMAMLVSEVPCVTAGTFTRNLVKAAPVLWDRQIVESGALAQAVVVNAGIANACTGEEGFDACRKTAAAVQQICGFAPEQVFVASTGVIGAQLPVDKLSAGVAAMVPQLADSREAGHLAARAIMTTDTLPKEVCVEVEISGTTVTIGGMCKGSGMIHPNMGTMLCFITTDVAIKKELLQKALYETVGETFNMVSVDGDTSTNDTCLVLANGLAGNAPIETEDAAYEAFKEGLMAVNKALAMKIAGDGEGATALFEVIVKNAADREAARTLSKSVVTSSLSKAAVYGHDANCGRFLCALGYSGIDFDPDQVDMWFQSEHGTLQVAENGVILRYSEEKAKEIMSTEHFTVICDMKQGDAEATAWGCDLTHEYVTINADYRS